MSEPIGPQSEEPIGPQSEEPIGPQSEEPIGPQSEEPIDPQSKEPIVPQSKEPIDPQSKEPIGPSAYNNITDHNKNILFIPYDVKKNIKNEIYETKEIKKKELNIIDIYQQSIDIYNKNKNNFNMFSSLERVKAQDLINGISDTLKDSEIILECGAGNGVFGGMLAHVFKDKQIISTDKKFYEENKEQEIKNYIYETIEGITAVEKYYNADTLIIMHYNPHFDEFWIKDTFKKFMKNEKSKKVIFIYTDYDIGNDLKKILLKNEEYNINTEKIDKCKYCNISVISKKQNGGYYKKYIKYKKKYLYLIKKK
jgi:hypothetical protein